MTVPTLVLALCVGAAAIALWTHMRYAALAPDGIRAATLHVAASLVLLTLVMPVPFQQLVGGGTSLWRTLAALFVIFLPLLAYTFLSGLWALAGFARRLETHRH